MVSSNITFISVDKDTTSRRAGNLHVHVNSSNSSIEEVLKNPRVDLINMKRIQFLYSIQLYREKRKPEITTEENLATAVNMRAYRKGHSLYPAK